MSQRLIERALAGELTHHLKQASPAVAGDPNDEPVRRNSRNGDSPKTRQTEQGEMTRTIPRDRRGEFEPVLVPKHQRRLAGLDEKILALYARGLSTRDISAQLEALYGAQISPALISEVTDAVSEAAGNKVLALSKTMINFGPLPSNSSTSLPLSNHSCFTSL